MKNDQQSIEFSPSFLNKVPESLITTLKQVSTLKAQLKNQVDICNQDINQDMARFKNCIKKEVYEGAIKGTGEKTIKKAKNAVREELARMQTALMALQNKVERATEEESKKDK